jgi:hypothetical protein
VIEYQLIHLGEFLQNADFIQGVAPDIIVSSATVNRRWEMYVDHKVLKIDNEYYYFYTEIAMRDIEDIHPLDLAYIKYLTTKAIEEAFDL